MKNALIVQEKTMPNKRQPGDGQTWKEEPMGKDIPEPPESPFADPPDTTGGNVGPEQPAPDPTETPDQPDQPDTTTPSTYDTRGRRTKVTGGTVDIGSGRVPEAGEGPDPFTTSGTGNAPEPSTWDVSREQTVKGQLEDNYDRNSPFMEKAAEETSRQHLAGGGQNSLMARKAGQAAAMDVAFKVSMADAATYARSAEFNAAMKNQFGLAEQRFIQNSLLSDQNYRQSIELQTQMIAGQLEGIRQEYLGKSSLMDKEFEQFFSKATYEAQLKEFAEQSGYQRQVSIQGMISNGAFLINGFNSVMEYANREGFTPEQSAAAIRSGMQFVREGFDINEAFWASVGAGPDRGGDFPNQPFNVGYEWWDFSEYQNEG
jgi:hypothetical protein